MVDEGSEGTDPSRDARGDGAALLRTLVELADSLVAGFDVIELLTLLMERSVQLLGADAAGLMLANAEGELRVLATSDEASLLELFELQTDEGPCMDCYRSGEQLLGEPLSPVGRWPRFAARAVAAGFRSVYALPMRHRGTVIGALNLFCRDPEHVPPVDAAQAMADIATIAILHDRSWKEAQQLNEQLTAALESRVVIEQAKGMVAAHRAVDLDTAFETIRSHARRHNLRLADVARQVISGDISIAGLELPPSIG